MLFAPTSSRSWSTAFATLHRNCSRITRSLLIDSPVFIAGRKQRHHFPERGFRVRYS